MRDSTSRSSARLSCKRWNRSESLRASTRRAANGTAGAEEQPKYRTALVDGQLAEHRMHLPIYSSQPSESGGSALLVHELRRSKPLAPAVRCRRMVA
jgi:hypothetical protein